MYCLAPSRTTSSQHHRTKGRIVRIDKTARQKGAPNWLKELLYIDEVGDDTKPTDKSDASGEGDVRDGESPKANAKRPTEQGKNPKEIAAESEGDLGFFSLREITGKAQSGVAKTLDQLFSGLMDRSMGETNFFVVTMMGLACAKVISAQFFEAEAFGELNLLAFLIAICTAAAFTASKRLPASPLAALCISVLPAFIETAAICTVRGLNFSEEYALITGLALACAAGGLFLGIARYLVDDTDPNEALKRAIIGAIWGFAIGATAAIIAETAPVIADALANRDIPTLLEQLLATR